MDNANKHWWEEEKPVEIFTDRPGVGGSGGEQPPVSEFKINAWGDCGGVGFTSKIDLCTVKTTINNILSIFTKAVHDNYRCDISECINILRQYYYYDTIDCLKWTKLFEDIFFKSKHSTDLIDIFTANESDKTYLNILRTNLRASENDIPNAINMWQDIYNNTLDAIPDPRKPYILSQIYYVQILTDQWPQSEITLKKMWSIMLLNTNSSSRFSFGIWDEWTLCLLITWFMAKHVKEYRDFYMQEIQKSTILPFNFQHKETIINNININFIFDIVHKNYYNYCKSNHSDLPSMEIN